MLCVKDLEGGGGERVKREAQKNDGRIIRAYTYG